MTIRKKKPEKHFVKRKLQEFIFAADFIGAFALKINSSDE